MGREQGGGVSVLDDLVEPVSMRTVVGLSTLLGGAGSAAWMGVVLGVSVLDVDELGGIRPGISALSASLSSASSSQAVSQPSTVRAYHTVHLRFF